MGKLNFKRKSCTRQRYG